MSDEQIPLKIEYALTIGDAEPRRAADTAEAELLWSNICAISGCPEHRIVQRYVTPWLTLAAPVSPVPAPSGSS